MGSEIGLLTAFVAGFLSFVAPCTLVLVPIFVAYLAGITISNTEELGQSRYRLPVFLNTVSFVLGLRPSESVGPGEPGVVDFPAAGRIP